MEPVKRFVSVPYWIWNVYFVLALIGADSVWRVISAGLFLWLGYASAHKEN